MRRHAVAGAEVLLPMRTEQRVNAASASLDHAADHAASALLDGAAGELARTYTRHALTALCREIRGPLHVIVGCLELLETSPPRHRAALIADMRQRADELLAVMGRAIQAAGRGGWENPAGAVAVASPGHGDQTRKAKRHFVSLWRHLLSRRRAMGVGAAP